MTQLIEKVLNENNQLDLGHGIKIMKNANAIYFMMSTDKAEMVVPIYKNNIQKVIDFLEQNK